MHIRQHIVTIVFLLSFSLLNAQTGIIKGTVTTSDGKPADLVNITVEKTDRGTIVNQKGHYTLDKIPTGTYILTASFMGLVTQTATVTVHPGKATTVDFVLVEDEKFLQSVIVAGQANKRASATVSKMPLKNLENPQVYNTVGSALMKEQMLTNYHESLNNIPGAVTTTVSGGNGGAYVQMRGFYSTAGFRDGLPVVQFAGSDPVNIEKIEAIKGPVGAMFGSVPSYGGLINRVTKRPYDCLGGNIEYYYGSNDLNRIVMDVNTPINTSKTLLFRLNAAFHSENSFQDYGYKKDVTVSPSVLFNVTDKLTVTLNSEFYNSKWIGTYYTYSFPTAMTNIKDFPVGYKQSIVGDGLESNSSTINHVAKAQYVISPHWKSVTSFTTMQNKWQPLYLYGLTWINDSDEYSRIVTKSERTTFNTFDVQQNFIGDFKLGSLRNRVLVGIDYYRYKANFGDYSTIYYDTIKLPAVSVAPMSKPRLQNMMRDAAYEQSSSGRRILAFYASDVINLTDNLVAMVSIRADRYHNDVDINNGVEDRTNVYNQTAWSPKFGIVYQPIKEQLSIFASYSNGFVNLGSVFQPDGSSSIFKPEQANQIEGGVKAEMFNHKLSGSLSYFNIRVNDKIRRDDATGFQIQDGSQRNEGVEFDLEVRPLIGFNIIAGYAYLEAKYLKEASDLKGKIPTTTPRHVANLWMSYTLSNGVGAALGGNYVGKSFGNAQNTFILPACTLINASLFYEFSNFRIGLKGNNLGNTKYWSINYYPQMPKQLVASISYKF